MNVSQTTISHQYRPPKYQNQIWSKNYKQIFKNGKEYGVLRKGNKFIEVEFLKVELDNEVITELPLKLHEIYREIEKSKYVLDLEDDWDDEGSITYKPATWIRAVKFIADYAKWVLEEASIVLSTPRISPGPNGSIDVLWKNNNFRLLINIPEDRQKQASFYGDDYGQEVIEGTFNPAKINQGILLSLLSMN